MSDESQQQEQQTGEHVRDKAPPAAEKVGEKTGERLAPFSLVIEGIENTEPEVLWGLGSTLMLRAQTDPCRLYYLTYEQLEAEISKIADAEGIQEESENADDDTDDQEELGALGPGPTIETAADDEAKLPDPPALNAAARICVQLNRIADALGADGIPFASDSNLDDVERVVIRLMDIAGALERLDLARPA